AFEKKGLARYKEPYRGIKAISISPLDLKHSKFSSDQIKRNFGAGVVSLFVLGWDNSHEVLWSLSKKMNIKRTNNTSYTWKIVMICPGEIEIERNRVKNEDGSHSVEKNENAVLFWKQGVVGFVLEEKDTIATYSIQIEQRNYAMDRNVVFRELVNPTFNILDTRRKYIIKGIFRGLDFNIEIINNGKSKINIDSHDIVFFPGFNNHVVGKQKLIIYPYMLYPSDLEAGAISEMLKFSIFSSTLSEILDAMINQY
ncbi:MAG: hypothetical protein OEW75_14475, partial [Cyclobacteriaceae bacterium]|nr:hypothetical protein [Cyclobacteriaceae bacterium]